MQVPEVSVLKFKTWSGLVENLCGGVCAKYTHGSGFKARCCKNKSKQNKTKFKAFVEIGSDRDDDVSRWNKWVIHLQYFCYTYS